MNSVLSLCFVVLTAIVPSLDGPEYLTTPETPIAQPLSVVELEELVDLLRAEQADLQREVDILRTRLALESDVTATCEASVLSLERQARSQNYLCEARLDLSDAECSCPAPWVRKVNWGLGVAIGGVVGYAVCD